MLALNFWASCVSQHGEKSLLYMAVRVHSQIYHQGIGLTIVVDVFVLFFLLSSAYRERSMSLDLQRSSHPWSLLSLLYKSE